MGSRFIVSLLIASQETRPSASFFTLSNTTSRSRRMAPSSPLDAFAAAAREVGGPR
jgi:hypothetical protein